MSFLYIFTFASTTLIISWLNLIYWFFLFFNLIFQRFIINLLSSKMLIYSFAWYHGFIFLHDSSLVNLLEAIYSTIFILWSWRLKRSLYGLFLRTIINIHKVEWFWVSCILVWFLNFWSWVFSRWLLSLLWICHLTSIHWRRDRYVFLTYRFILIRILFINTFLAWVSLCLTGLCKWRLWCLNTTISLLFTINLPLWWCSPYCIYSVTLSCVISIRRNICGLSRLTKIIHCFIVHKLIWSKILISCALSWLVVLIIFQWAFCLIIW
jgi:hypothetical protein